MQLKHLSTLLAVTLMVPTVLTCGHKKTYDPKDWRGEVLMNKSPDTNDECYHATLTNKYRHHNYDFDVIICKDKDAVIYIKTAHGKGDRYFKVNFNDINGKALGSATSYSDNTSPYGCEPEISVKRDQVDHITVQEWKTQYTSCWFGGPLGCEVVPPPYT
jgi:hypothetical protein